MADRRSLCFTAASPLSLPSSKQSGHSALLTVKHRYHPVCTIQESPPPTQTSKAPSLRGTVSNPYKISILPGDGVGPSTTEAATRMLDTLSTVTDVHFNFDVLSSYNSSTPQEIDEGFVGKCRENNGVILRGAAGKDRSKGVRLARKLMDALGLKVQLRPGTVYEWQGMSGRSGASVAGYGMDVMLVREVGGGAMRGESIGDENGVGDGKRLLGLEECKSEILYRRQEVEEVAEWAARIAGMRGGRLVNVDKSDVMNVSRFWRSTVHETFKKVVPNTDSVQLSDMYVDDFARELILNPTAFDTILTSNLFGDVLAEVIGALAGPARIAPAAWLASDGTAVYGPADVYNPSAYTEPRAGEAYPIKQGDEATAANLFAMYRAVSMMLRYSFEEPGAADLIQNALGKVMKELVGRYGIGKEINQDDDDDQRRVSSRPVLASVDMISGEDFEEEFINQLNFIRQYEQVCDPLVCGE